MGIVFLDFQRKPDLHRNPLILLIIKVGVLWLLSVSIALLLLSVSMSPFPPKFGNPKLAILWQVRLRFRFRFRVSFRLPLLGSFDYGLRYKFLPLSLGFDWETWIFFQLYCGHWSISGFRLFCYGIQLDCGLRFEFLSLNFDRALIFGMYRGHRFLSLGFNCFAVGFESIVGFDLNSSWLSLSFGFDWEAWIFLIRFLKFLSL